MKNHFTTKERYAIVNILYQIMKADGIIHSKEEMYMDFIYGELDIKISDLEEISNINDIQARLIIDDMSDENKDLAHSLFIGMAESDGYVHPKEIEIINKLFNK